MDEKKTDPSGYEPNFVMKDAAEPEAAENQPNMAENQPDMPEDPAKAAAPPGDQEDFAQKAASGASNDFEKKGAFRDPREAFRNTEPGTSSYQYNEHNRPGSVKDNFGGSPYTGYVDENGNWTIKPDKKYKAGDTAWLVYFSGGLRGFEKKEKYNDNATITLIGFFDEHGKEVIPAEFCEVMYPFYNDVALVASPAKKDGEKAIYGYINKKGKYLMKKEYDFDLDRVRD